jgi:two-component system response regulator (stage 0 sporulation protein F)
MSRLPEPNAIEEVTTPSILLAEDDTMFRGLVAGMLRRDGYRVVEAKDGERLARLVRSMLLSGHERRPELIITDIRMPGITGIEVLRSLRSFDRFVPVILMTGFGSAETSRVAERLGAAAVYSKLFDLRDLRRKVHEMLPGL